MADFFVPHDIEAPIAGAAGGPLAGLTVAIKDMYDIAGTRTGGGNPDWLAAQQPAQRHAAAVQKLLDAGATIIGKTICDEFFYSITGINAHYGTPTNMRAPGRVPGGSSSGSAAAVAANACDVALGSDTGGSVRIPASFCGLYGIRPSLRRVDLTGAMPMAMSFDVGGWFANSAGVLRKVGGVLLEGEAVASKSGGDRISALYAVENLFEQADAPVAALCREFLTRAAPALPRQLTSQLAPANLEKWRDAFRIVQARETWESDGAFITSAQPRLGPGIRERMAFAATVTAAQAEAARVITLEAREHIRASLEGNRIYALPTAPGIAPRLDASDAELDAFRTRVQRLTCIAGLAGCPQVTLPVGTVDGCPAGLSLLGWPGSDEILLDLAVRVARYCGIAR